MEVLNDTIKCFLHFLDQIYTCKDNILAEEIDSSAKYSISWFFCFWAVQKFTSILGGYFMVEFAGKRRSEN